MHLPATWAHSESPSPIHKPTVYTPRHYMLLGIQYPNMRNCVLVLTHVETFGDSVDLGGWKYEGHVTVQLSAVFMRQDKTIVRATEVLFVLHLAFKESSSLFSSSSAQLSGFELSVVGLTSSLAKSPQPNPSTYHHSHPLARSFDFSATFSTVTLHQSSRDHSHCCLTCVRRLVFGCLWLDV